MEAVVLIVALMLSSAAIAVQHKALAALFVLWAIAMAWALRRRRGWDE